MKAHLVTSDVPLTSRYSKSVCEKECEVLSEVTQQISAAGGTLEMEGTLSHTGNYRTIYADPPWMERGAGKVKRGADRHYSLMPTESIMRMPVAWLAAPDAHLYLWVTNNFLLDGLAVMRAWGFEYKTIITWAKDKIGLGQYFRGQTEQLLFGVRGCLPYKITGGKRQQGTTLITAPRGQHSAKPEQARSMIEIVSYEPRIEIFARNHSAGWDVYGNETEWSACLDVPLFDHIAPPAVPECSTTSDPATARKE